MAKIGLIDVDGSRFPNLALMKISAWHKERGDSVEWYSPWDGHFDKVYASKVFSFTPDYDTPINADIIEKGGTGYCINLVNGKEVFDRSKNKGLPSEIEHICPDYSLYPQYTQNTAYGFLTRGCPRGCDFCIVKDKEGIRSLKVADLEEFWSGQGNIVLCDPNILACPQWPELFDQLGRSGAHIDFNQGLDIRLMTEEKAEAISSLKIREIHFAWDRYNERDLVLPKLELYARYTSFQPHAHKAIVYVLTNYDTTFEQDLDRIYTLRDMGYWPYIMIYDKKHCAQVYRDLQRWVNNRWIFGSCEKFEDYGKAEKKNLDKSFF